MLERLQVPYMAKRSDWRYPWFLTRDSLRSVARSSITDPERQAHHPLACTGSMLLPGAVLAQQVDNVRMSILDGPTQGSLAFARFERTIGASL